MKATSTILLAFLIINAHSIKSQDFSALKYRNVGPERGGRVTTVAGIASKPSTYYLGATGGGVWKTEDYGTTWSNVSDGYFETPSIGAIAVAQNDENIVYAGTGSDGLRSNVISGKGVYKSIDAGKTWDPIGLTKTGHIGALEIHPENHNIVYVAAIGQAFQPNAERGIYKTTDGGKSWKKKLFISDKVGFADLELLPGNPEIIYAAAWKAERKPWTIISGGTTQEGGIYKSMDGGTTWEKVTKGLPEGLIGKIDLAVCPGDSRIVYALIEAPDDKGGLYKSTDQGKSFQQVSDHKGIRERPFYYTNIEVDPKNPDIVYAMATSYYKSVNGGKSWSKLSPPHGDNHDMWINPNNTDLFIQANDGGANVTHNGGQSWSTQFNQPTTEIYQVEVDDQYPYWLYGGQQDNYTTISVPSMAPYGVQRAGIGWIMNTGGCETGPAVPKPGNPDIVYANCKGRFTVYDKRTGIEKSYYVGASNMYGHNPKDLNYRFQRVSPIHVSPHDAGVIFHGSQYVHRTRDEGVTWETISPDLTAFKADKQVISGSPITRDITGEEFYSTLYSIRESPVQKGVIWTGANDGPVYVTQNDGKTWDNVTPSKLPQGGRVDAVEPSPHNAEKAYIAVLRYQLGDWKPYIYKTENYGKSWKLLTTGTNGIPADYPTRVIREDPKRPGLLYAGTEWGMFISFNDGEQWVPFQQNLPLTPITDIKIHRNDLVLSTMGRSFWVLDNIATLRDKNITNLKDNAVLFKPSDTYRFRYPKVRTEGAPLITYPKPSVIIDYYLSESTNTSIRLDIMDDKGNIVNTYFGDSSQMKGEEQAISDMSTNTITYLVDKKLTTHKGLNRFHWNMTYAGPWSSKQRQRYKNGPLAAPGVYTAKLTIGSATLTQTFNLMQDPRNATHTTSDHISELLKLQLDLIALLTEARKLEDELNKEFKQLDKKKKVAGLPEYDTERHVTLSNVLQKLKTAEGTYPQPMLADQINYLYNMMNKADQQPGKDALERFKVLKNELGKLKAML
ncbi:hypothetical protein FNH22_07525 [Fulvivirga sp. M361]|uniref:WD40/YVTN/BNR-like repeat-containing protein n=1 Tax=Fulvivirga sp. M361 TaxID=2594266 RepID=UPI00117B42EA|nr:hypothetical protein [Fulvivirga sp. M361]TRX59895.1 hypothetical protein FNH22_07525 [Fulvivirga sp. M361]